MAQFKSIRDDDYYKKKIYKNSGPKPEAHFYPDVSDEILRSDRYDIDWTLSFVDCKRKIDNLEDFWTPQMVFANTEVANTYNVFIHYLDTKNDTQRVARVEFNMRNEIIVKEWV